MTTLTADPTLARVEYYDSSYGGWRAIDTFGDAPTALMTPRRARAHALSASEKSSTAFRVQLPPTATLGIRYERYTRGRKLR